MAAMEMMMAVMTRMVLVMEIVMVMVLVMEMATKLSKHYSPSLRPLPVWVVVAKGCTLVQNYNFLFKNQ